MGTVNWKGPMERTGAESSGLVVTSPGTMATSSKPYVRLSSIVRTRGSTMGSSPSM